MAQDRPNTPPPLPNAVDFGIDWKKALLVLVPVAVLAVVLLVVSLIFVTQRPDAGSGSGESGSAAGPGQSVSDSENVGKEIGASVDQPGEGESNSPRTDGETGDNGPGESDKEQKTERRSSQSIPGVAGSDVTAPEVAFEDGISLDVPHSSRKVRNTFNPFGNTSPPRKASSSKSIPGEVGKSAEFFGVAAEGRTFVYVVDKSISMAGDKLFDACNELLDSIDALKPNQAFLVVFFDSVYHVQQPGKFLKATPRNKRTVRDWVMTAVPSGGTEPYNAIEYALAMRPDAVFVLSDGEFEDYAVNLVTQINNNFTISINTIAFRTNARTLKDLAEQNRGTYRFVP